MRILVFTVVTFALLFAAGPYGNVVFLRLLGDTATSLVERDGSVMTMVHGPNAPQPKWLKLEPGALLASATRWQPNKYMKDGGLVDVVSRSALTGIKTHYVEALAGEGFDAEDLGFGPPHPGTARHLGIEAFVAAEDAARNIEVSIQIGTRDAITGSRVVKVQWRERWPGQPGGLDALRKKPLSAPQAPAAKM